MIGLVRWLCVIALILLLGYVAARTRKQLGRVEDRSMANFFALMGGGEAHIGIANELGFGVAYLPWLVAYTLFGSPEPTTPQIVEEKVSLPDFDEILRTLNFELRTLLKDLPQTIIDAMVEDARDLLKMNLTPQYLDDRSTLNGGNQYLYDQLADLKKHYEKEHDDVRLLQVAVNFDRLYEKQLSERIYNAGKFSPLMPLREAFVALGSSIKLTSNGLASKLTAPLPDLITPDALNDFYYRLVKHDIFGLTYGLFVQKWNDLREKMKLTEPGERLPENYADRLMLHLTALNLTLVPIAIPQAQRFEGTWIVAPQGRGKPPHDWGDETAWRLFNATTFALTGRVAENPAATRQLHDVIDGVCETVN